MANDLIVINKSDVELVATQVPQAYETSRTSHDACLNAGQALLEKIQREGMSDALEAEAALFITKAKKTVVKINDLRSPATKLFDQFKKVFTTMENDIDVTKQGSVVFQIQAYRNQYAAKKREEEERRRQEELRRQQMEQARKQYRTDCEEEYLNWNNTVINNRINHLDEIFSQTTLANYAETEKVLRGYQITIPEDWDSQFVSSVRLPSLISREECAAIRQDVRKHLMDTRIREEYKFSIENERDELLTKLPSKKKELEKIAAAEAANAAEAARLRAEQEAKERAEAQAREEERRQKEEERRQKEEARRAAEAVGGLFDNTAATAVVGVQTKTIVKKKVNVLNPEGFLEVIGMWWEYAGKTMTVEQLNKEFSKQLTLCNKLANDATSPKFIQSEHVEYVDDVKAK